MSALRQVLKPAEFAKLRPGMDQAEVRRLLGRPANTRRLDLKPDDEHGRWRWLDGHVSQRFNVTFDRDGKVASSAPADDLRDAQGGR